MFQTFKYMCCGIQKVNTFRKDRDSFINTQIDINLLSIFSNENSEWKIKDRSKLLKIDKNYKESRTAVIFTSPKCRLVIKQNKRALLNKDNNGRHCLLWPRDWRESRRRRLSEDRRGKRATRSLSSQQLFFILIVITLLIIIIIIILIEGCTQIPISTLSHIWVFVRLYGIVFVIIVIIIIIIMIIKSEGVNAQL